MTAPPPAPPTEAPMSDVVEPMTDAEVAEWREFLVGPNGNFPEGVMWPHEIRKLIARLDRAEAALATAAAAGFARGVEAAAALCDRAIVPGFGQHNEAALFASVAQDIRALAARDGGGA